MGVFMKILIDIGELERDGLVDDKMAAMLRAHAVRDTGSTAINILLAFGAIAIAAGILSLQPSPFLGSLLGLAFVGLGFAIRRQFQAQWGKLGGIWMIVGALILAGGVGAIIDQPFAGSCAAALILAAVGVLAGSRLLIALTPLALASAIGGSTGYWHACYMIAITEPSLTIALFFVLGLAGWLTAKGRAGLFHTLSITFARMCVILVNFGFWVGSLWGDTPGRLWRDPNSQDYFGGAGGQQIPPMAFIIGWAIALLAAGAWGARNGRRFLVNTVAVFGGIHFFTQWFELIGFYPVSVILAGIAVVAFGLGLWKYNQRALTAGKS
jgi:iron complex transport system permease protein